MKRDNMASLESKELCENFQGKRKWNHIGFRTSQISSNKTAIGFIQKLS